MLKTCDARLAALQEQATNARRIGNILLIVGASIAALGSALAGFLNKSGHRKAMAVIGALGAVIAVLPKTLDDPSELLTRRATAERHRDMAFKVKLQLPYLPIHYEVFGKQYLVARLVDCTNSTPPEKVPEPPPVPSDGEMVKQRVDYLSWPYDEIPSDDVLRRRAEENAGSLPSLGDP